MLFSWLRLWVLPCRPDIADTGRIVGTGCDSPQAARLAIARAQRQIALEAGIFLRVRNFAVREFPHPATSAPLHPAP